MAIPKNPSIERLYQAALKASKTIGSTRGGSGYSVARTQRRWQIRGIRPDGGRLAFTVLAYDYAEAKRFAKAKARGGNLTDIVLLD